MTSTLVLLGVSWRNGIPFLRIRQDREGASRVVEATGLKLNYRIGPEVRRVCVGHVPFRSDRGDYHDCHNPPQEGKRTCERCSIVEATFASNLHHAHTRGSAELDPAVRDHLRQPNRLYLAAFRDGSIKVGTSTVSRNQKRLEEQGAWMARLVAETTDGVAVRSLEDMVTEVWSIPQAVSGSRKVKGLVSPIEDSEIDRRLDEAARQVRQLMDRTPDERVAPLGEAAELGERWRNPMASHPDVAGAIGYPLSLRSGNHDLTIATAIGRTLLVRRSNGPDVFAIDPAPLFGIELDIGDYGSDEIAIQDSLF